MPEGPVLIVSASAGTGHVRAGAALERAFADHGVEARHVDVLSLAPRLVRTAYGGGFELLARRAPRVWREIYERSDGPDCNDAPWGPHSLGLLFREFRSLLRSRPWRLVLSTHFLPSQLAAGQPGMPPFGLVVTDYTLHRYWAQPRVREYFVADESMAAGIRQRVGGARVTVTGIPVDPRFGVTGPIEQARRAIGVAAHRQAVVVMGGGLGIGVEDAVENALAATPPDVQILAVCGRNQTAPRALRRLGAQPDRLRVFGYVEDIELIFAAADLVITKPGGLTTSEALALGRPLLLTRAIPGHEEGNVRHLMDRGVALSGQTSEELRASLARFFAEPALQARLALSAGRHGASDAAARIVAETRDYTATRAVA